MELKTTRADIAIIGGGTAGCYAALCLARKSQAQVVVVEKANIVRSGCLAAGVNAINAYVGDGHTPEDYADYAAADAHGIARYDLLLSMSQRLNNMVKALEDLGLTIQKDENGYATRLWRNVKINGENIKPLLAKAVLAEKNITVLNRHNAISFLTEDQTIKGLIALSTDKPMVHVIQAGAVICTTGGAAGLYRPNNFGSASHKMWYCPFNTGAGLAMGIMAGAEMTTLEMRFVALRCQDTIAPTGTLAIGAGARQINAQGERYDQNYGRSTSQRVYGTLRENLLGRGPCRLETGLLEASEKENILKAYLNMAPAQTLRWLEEEHQNIGKINDDRKLSVLIEGSEPYIVGGHTSSGYWIDTKRQTTIKGLFAAGDVAGGCPQKYVSGAMAEAEIASEAAGEYLLGLRDHSHSKIDTEKILGEATGFLYHRPPVYTTSQLEEAMQKTMDQSAGGLATGYRFNLVQLNKANETISELLEMSTKLAASNMRELLAIYELKDRLVLATSLIAHLKARKETRWPGFAEFSDYPQIDENFNCYVNSRVVDGRMEIIFRKLLTQEKHYEHSN